MQAPRKLMRLTLQQKHEILQLHDKENLTVKQLAARFKCGKTQIYSCLTRRDFIKDKFYSSRCYTNLKSFKEVQYEDLNNVVFEWVCIARSKNIDLTGPIIQAEAKKIAAKMNLTEFKASCGWLRSFNHRYNIKSSRAARYENNMDENIDAEAEWITHLLDICENYEPKNIGNCDETALFIRMLPSELSGSSKDKPTHESLDERVTILLTVFGDGTIAKPLLIAKLERSNSFKNMNLENLGIEFYCNKNAFMTEMIFEQYLHELNNQMKAEERSIVLILDKATSHLNLALSNIRLEYIPPNATSRLQPLNAGIFTTLKINYRKLLLQKCLVEMSTMSSVLQLAKKITFFDAVQFLRNACQQLTPPTIIKYFLRCGFVFDEPDSPDGNDCDDEDDQHEVELQIIFNLIQSIYGRDVCSANDYITVDENVETEVNTLVEIKTETLIKSDDEHFSDDDEDELEITNEDVMKAFNVLEAYGRQSGRDEFYRKMCELKIDYIQNRADESVMSMIDFLDPEDVWCLQYR